MNVYLHEIATHVPANSASQDELAVCFGAWAQDPALARIIGHIFKKTGIRRRHSVLRDFTEPEHAELFRADGPDPIEKGRAHDWRA